MKAAVAEPKAKTAKSPQAESDLSLFTFYCLLGTVLVVSCLLYTSVGYFWTKFSRAEVFFAECAREMIATNNYVTPLYHNQPFFDKPILIYWFIIAMFKNFGFTHLAARIPSIYAGLGAVAVTAFSGAALFGRRIGLMGAAMLATAFMFLSFAASCMSDMALVLMDCITLTCIYAGLQSDSRRTLLWFLAAVSMGVAFLIKGPVGFVLPSVAALIFMTFTKQLNKTKFVHVATAFVTLAIISSPWFIAAYKANGISAITYFFVHENLQRFAGETYDAHRPFWYTAGSLLSGFAPWSIFLPLALFDFCKGWYRGDKSAAIDRQLFLWTWIVVLVAFFSCSRGKCDYYTLPVFPAAALLSAWSVDAQMRKRTLLSTWTLAIFSVFLIGSGIGSGFIANKIVSGSFLWLLVPGSLCLFGGAGLWAILTKKPYYSFALSFAGLAAGITCFAIAVLPGVARLIPTEKYALLIKAAPPAATVYMQKSLYSWRDELSFQTGRHPEVTESNGEFESIIKRGGQFLLVMDENTYLNLSAASRSKLKLISKDYAITKPITPALAIKTGGQMTDSTPVMMLAHI
jgi:4-amino-4-deoxy-L-arabinose transferase-like glycosyltransferase